MEVKDLIYLGKPLRYFVNHFQINIYQGNIVINLVDYLPLLKLGYTYHDHMSDLMDSFRSIDQEQYDKISKIAFDSDIPAEFYSVINRNHKMSMDKAIKEMYTDKIWNTYQILRQFRDDDKFDIDDLIDYNSYNINEDKLLEKYSKDKNFIRRMKYEADKIMIISYISFENRLTGKDTPLLFFINSMIQGGLNNDNLYKTMAIDDKIKLYVAIIEKDINKVKSFLLTIDPRFDSNQAYILAIEVGNDKIIKIIKDQIIKDNWYEKQVYLKYAGDEAYDIQKHHNK